ncbi:MAG: TetR family transcriptional regulator C-terminal domain-containing protein [Pseudomonadota bacterium]
MTLPTPTTTRRRTAPSSERRRQLIEAATEVIAETGLSGIKTSDVARRAGLSVGLINHYFSSKDNLLAETLRHLGDELRARWVRIQQDDTLDTAEKLAAIVDGMFHPSVATPTKIAVWFAFFGDAGYRELYRDMAGDFDTERSAAIEALCHTLKTEGGYAGINAEALATTIEALADGLWLSTMLYPDWLLPREARRRVFELLATQFPRHFTGDGLSAGGTEPRS